MNNEPVAIRYDFDGYGYKYMDSGSGSDWQTRAEGEFLYTHPVKEQGNPVAWMDYLEHSDVYDLNVSGRGIPLYTHPVKELTDNASCAEQEVYMIKNAPNTFLDIFFHNPEDAEEWLAKEQKKGHHKTYKVVPYYPVKELTDEEIEKLREYHGINDWLYETSVIDFARAIEAKVRGEK